MMYRVLLAGNNNTIINEFFERMEEQFLMLTTSNRYNDILNHLKYFEPDAFIYCMNNEGKDDINMISSIREYLVSNSIPLVIIGSDEDCNVFMQYSHKTADLALVKPITATEIRDKITEYLAAQYAMKEAISNEKKRLAKEKVKKHILVVDDDPLMLRVIKGHLSEKYNVATANSGKIALKFLEKKKTDLILLDYNMPVEDGPAVLKKLHENEATKNIPVLFLTGITERDKIKKALEQKPQGYLLKPVDREAVLEAITKCIG